MPVVGTDFHGNLKKLDKFLNYKPDKEHIYAGDAVDSWNESPESQLKLLKTLVEDTECVLIYGNHELAYAPKFMMSCSGNHSFGRDNFEALVLSPKWKVAYVSDIYLITHAGVSTKHANKKRTADSIANDLTKKFSNRKSDIWDIGYCRGGYKSCGGPFWYDFRYDAVKLADVNQVFGHCSIKEPWQDVTEKGNKHFCINSMDTTDDCWVFDTEEDRVVIL